MLISIEIDSNYKHATVADQKFSVDADAMDVVENLKAIISLKFTDLDPNSFDLFYDGQKIDEKSVLKDLSIVEGKTILLRGKKNRFSKCCDLL